MRFARKVLVAASLGAVSWSVVGVASAQSVIKRPDDHPKYRAELEPHGVVKLWHRNFGPYGRRYGNDSVFGRPEFGGGFRATIEVGDPAFVPPINNTVGITFGVDSTWCNGYCGGEDVLFYFPVGLQWNFFFTKEWSVMAEGGGVLLGYGFFDEVLPDFFASVGGRYHFNDNIALTMKTGYPFAFSIGPSFFVGD